MLRLKHILFPLLASLVFACASNTPLPENQAAGNSQSAAGENSSTDSTSEINTVLTTHPLDDSHVRLLGRSVFMEDCVFLGYTCTGVEFDISARRLNVSIAGDSGANMVQDNGSAARICVFLDDERVLDKMILEQSQTFTVFDKPELVEGTVRILKVSECSSSLAAIEKIQTDENGTISATAPRELSIEFIGDSITCGYGVDDLNSGHHFATSTEDGTKTYAYKAASALNADFSFVSVSGSGVISSYTGDGSRNTSSLVPTFYDKLGFVWSSRIFGRNPAKFQWEFANFQPDIVVINLGTNDASYTKGNSQRIAEYEQAYVAFIKDVRSKNPGAHIICSLGIMGQDLCDAVDNAVASYIGETDDAKISTLRYAQQRASDGIAADWHPSEKTHAKAATKLVEEIQSLGY